MDKKTRETVDNTVKYNWGHFAVWLLQEATVRNIERLNKKWCLPVGLDSQGSLEAQIGRALTIFWDKTLPELAVDKVLEALSRHSLQPASQQLMSKARECPESSGQPDIRLGAQLDIPSPEVLQYMAQNEAAPDYYHSNRRLLEDILKKELADFETRTSPLVNKDLKEYEKDERGERIACQTLRNLKPVVQLLLQVQFVEDVKDLLKTFKIGGLHWLSFFKLHLICGVDQPGLLEAAIVPPFDVACYVLPGGELNLIVGAKAKASDVAGLLEMEERLGFRNKPGRRNASDVLQMVRMALLTRGKLEGREQLRKEETQNVLSDEERGKPADDESIAIQLYDIDPFNEEAVHRGADRIRHQRKRVLDRVGRDPYDQQ